MESIAADEFRRMGFESVTAENGRVKLSGSINMLARANICSRYAERIMIDVGEFRAATFTELFDGVKSLPWEDYIGKYDAFPVNGRSIDSALFSIPDCQSIVKKAIVERLKQKYHISHFEETGAEYRVRFFIYKNVASLMIDTSGEGLHKRGYRRKSNDAPLKETLGAAMCDLARIYPDTLMFDPFCGSGTLLIEAALKANIEFRAQGFDIDPNAVALTNENAEKAGMKKYVKASVGDVRDFTVPDERCLVITNPPYGERLLDVKAAEELYAVMGQRFKEGCGRKYYIISPHDEFERFFGREADKRRKLYNGMIKCQLFMYFKNRER